MAEIFAAVASGAGLVSLAIQLLESSRKLKGLYNASKDAPKTVESLCFELETLSLQLRQLERHRLHDHLNTDILDRCIAICESRTLKVQDVVDEMSRHIRRSAAFGRMYTAFKEPEVNRLIEDLEQAKSSLSLAYISYCQSWSMRDSAKHSDMLSQHGDMLAVQQLQLEDIRHGISQGHELLVKQSKLVATHNGDESKSNAMQHHSIPSVQKMRRRSNKSSRRFHLSLPLLGWLTNRTWEIAVSESQGLWTVNMQPVSMRPYSTPVFQYVWKGDIHAVRKLLDVGALSIWDRAHWLNGGFVPHLTLPALAAVYGQFELCEYLLMECEAFQEQHMLSEAWWRVWYMTEEIEHVAKFFDLLVGKFGMPINLFGPEGRWPHPSLPCYGELIMSYQDEVIESLSLEERCSLSLRLRESWPEDFMWFIGSKASTKLATQSDSQGETALNWAAQRFGNHLSYSKGCVPTPRALRVAEFISALLQAGAPVHAVSPDGWDPLTCLVHMTLWYEDRSTDQPFGLLPWAIKQWGELLVAAGLSLADYVKEENIFLRTREAREKRAAGLRDRYYQIDRLVVSPQMSLQAEFRAVGEVQVFEFQPPPGSIVDPDRDLHKICWSPDDLDEHDLFWQPTELLTLRSAKAGPRPAVSYSLSREDIVRMLFQGTQDDHSAVATTCQRHERSRQREQQGQTVRRRGVSAPSLSPDHDDSLVSTFDIKLWERNLDMHKCPLDSRWWIAPRLTWSISPRDCMQGHCGRRDYGSEIEQRFRFRPYDEVVRVREVERLKLIVERV